MTLETESTRRSLKWRSIWWKFLQHSNIIASYICPFIGFKVKKKGHIARFQYRRLGAFTFYIIPKQANSTTLGLAKIQWKYCCRYMLFHCNWQGIFRDLNYFLKDARRSISWTRNRLPIRGHQHVRWIHVSWVRDWEGTLNSSYLFTSYLLKMICWRLNEQEMHSWKHSSCIPCLLLSSSLLSIQTNESLGQELSVFCSFLWGEVGNIVTKQKLHCLRKHGGLSSVHGKERILSFLPLLDVHYVLMMNYWTHSLN